MPTETERHPTEEPFIIIAMLSLVMATLWAARRHELFLNFYYSTEMLGLTHLVTLGFITSIIMGILHRLVPMALSVEPLSRRLSHLQLLLFAVGGSGMVLHFVWEQWAAVAWATLLVWTAALVQLINWSRVARLAWDGDWIATYVTAALVHLVFTASLGALYGLNHTYGVAAGLVTASTLNKLSAHLHIGAIGWMTTMIFGFQLKLVPTTAGNKRWWPLRFALLQIGLVGLVAALLTDGGRLQIPFALMIVAAIFWQAAGPIRSLPRRRGWLWEAVALIVLVLLAIVGLALACGLPGPTSPLRLRIQFAYGYVALLGWVLMTVAAVAFKLFPMWVWQERFARDFGNKPTPSVVSLYSDRLRDLSGICSSFGVAAVAAGIVSLHELTLRIGLWLVVAGALAFVANFVRTARWALLPIEYVPSERDRARFEGRKPHPESVRPS